MKKTSQPFISIGKRKIGPDYPPFIVAEIGINHEGDMNKAKKMISDIAKAGGECVKFQCHVVEDEMAPIAKKIIPQLPINTKKDSIWEIMSRCAFSEEQERELKKYAEGLGLIYLSTPFSRAAADRLHRMNVIAYKIGSGECNNYPLVEHIASFGKPIILSTGMNDINSIKPAVKIFEKNEIPFAILHCTSMYPTPYEKARLGALFDLQDRFPGRIVGISDHSLMNYTSFGAVALGASIIEKHFTSDSNWPGPDIAISINPSELKELIIGSNAIFKARGGKKDIISGEKPTIDFAYSCVVAIKKIKKGEKFTAQNIWVKRPGTGEIKAVNFNRILNRVATQNIDEGQQIKWTHIKQRKR